MQSSAYRDITTQSLFDKGAEGTFEILVHVSGAPPSMHDYLYITIQNAKCWYVTKLFTHSTSNQSHKYTFSL